MMDTKRLPTAIRRDQAVGHAADLLREGGPNALTSIAVAERMGVSQSAVYRHISNMDELSASAAAAVVDELNTSLQDVLFDPNIDWEDVSDIGRLCRDLIDKTIRNPQSIEVAVRWRFIDGALGAGIRKVLDEGTDLIATLLETRWRIEFGYAAPLGESETAALRLHAEALHDDIRAVARLASAPSAAPAEPDDVAGIMRNRLIAGWAAFVIDMNARVGLAFPQIDLTPPALTD
jgi:AcrR family transcriptional regulator